MFFCFLRAVKGEHGEAGKLLRVRWLLVTVISWLLFLQRFGGVGAHEAECLCGDSGDDYRQYDSQC